jgi:hypothetical protein
MLLGPAAYDYAAYHHNKLNCIGLTYFPNFSVLMHKELFGAKIENGILSCIVVKVIIIIVFTSAKFKRNYVRANM